MARNGRSLCGVRFMVCFWCWNGGTANEAFTFPAETQPNCRHIPAHAVLVGALPRGKSNRSNGIVPLDVRFQFQRRSFRVAGRGDLHAVSHARSLRLRVPGVSTVASARLGSQTNHLAARGG